MLAHWGAGTLHVMGRACNADLEVNAELSLKRHAV